MTVFNMGSGPFSQLIKNTTKTINSNNLYNNNQRMNNEQHFECIRLKNSTKKGVLTPDENGCYTLVVGAIGAYNSAGAFYDYDSAAKFFTKDSSFQRKIARGVLRGEYGHPVKTSSMSEADYFKRILTLDEKSICCEFTEIWLKKEKLNDDKGRPVTVIMAKVRPMGPYGECLRKQLETPGMQVCFSIRSFTESVMRGGVEHKFLDKIITFDYVNEPGMYNAEKLLSPTLESHAEHTFSMDEIIENIKKTPKGLSNENSWIDVKYIEKEFNCGKQVGNQLQISKWL
jgi:hypothetical protein